MKAFKGFINISGTNYRYEGQQYSRKSKYGIEGGRIKQLTINCKGKVVTSYDKTWDIKPSTTQQIDAFDIIMYDYN